MTADPVTPKRCGPTSPENHTERALAEVLAGVVQVTEVGVDSHFFDDLGADSMIMAQFCARVRKRSDLPSVSMKDIYQHSTIKDLAASLLPPAPPPATTATTATEAALTEILAGVMRVDDIGVDSHFFDDLGADSMIMAQFCARVRKRSDLPSVSMKDIYRHSTIKDLAAALAKAEPDLLPADLPVRDLPAPVPSSELTAPAPAEPAPRASRASYVICGALQLALFLGYATLGVAIAARGYVWVAAGNGLLDIYLRSILFSGATFVGFSLLPIVAKWVLIGRWKPQRIRIWSLGYVRFWLVKTLIRGNPLAVIMVGSPLHVLYLRALGARVGKGVAIFSAAIPVCTDLLTIGDGTVIRKGVALSCYRAHDGVIETGAVTLGREVLVSDATVLDIDTSMGDGAQLGHSSALHSGQAVPAGERFHGSPAVWTETDYAWVPPAPCGILRRVLYPLAQVLSVILIFGPLAIGGAVVLVKYVPQIPALLDSAHLTPASPAFYLEALLLSFALLFTSMIIALLFVASVPRLLNRAIEPERVYSLYGVRYSLHKAVRRMTNLRSFTHLFGDSSFIVGYLSYIGWNLHKVEQTGSNFGTMVGHDNPYLSAVGSGTMSADGLSMNNADYSSTSFRLSQTTIGAQSFLGNYIAYPSQARIGDNCLLATKVMVPVDGKIRQGVGLLGSPSFEIPRSVSRDTSVDITSSEERLSRLVAKDRHNLITMGLTLLVRWGNLWVTLMLAMVVTDFYRAIGQEAIVIPVIAALLFSLAYFTLIERASTGFRRLRPQYCSIYDPYFWWHERFWKLSLNPFERLLAGTPFKGLLLRLQGVHVGRQLFDDGCAMPEKTLVTIGDHCTVNAGTMIQCHSQEDGAFKSDAIVLGNGCTVGVGAVVHYGTSMGDGSVLAADSFLMKGEQVPPHAFWGGNPAEEMPPSLAQSAPNHPETPSEALPDEPWSWDLSAALLVDAAATNGHVKHSGTTEGVWSWDLSSTRPLESALIGSATNGHAAHLDLTQTNHEQIHTWHIDANHIDTNHIDTWHNDTWHINHIDAKPIHLEPAERADEPWTWW